MGGNGSASGFINGDRYITDIDGSLIDLGNSPLTYGKDDPWLTGNARKVIEEFENKRYKNKIEYSRFIDMNGNVIEENRGSKGSVKASFIARLNADAMSHNHPRRIGVLGGTFSGADLNNFIRFSQRTYRATAKEGTYSITKGSSFDGAGLKKYYADAYSKSIAAVKVADSKRIADYKAGKITYSQALKVGNDISNAHLVNMHNVLLTGAKKYGYAYTLERRKK